MSPIPNRTTPEGRALGSQMARLCNVALTGKTDLRCGTCAFRAGDHLANGSPETLMDAMKCVIEGVPFYCHEQDRPCAGWVASTFKDSDITAPWEFTGGVDEVAA